MLTVGIPGRGTRQVENAFGSGFMITDSSPALQPVKPGLNENRNSA